MRARVSVLGVPAPTAATGIIPPSIESFSEEAFQSDAFQSDAFQMSPVAPAITPQSAIVIVTELPPN